MYFPLLYYQRNSLKSAFKITSFSTTQLTLKFKPLISCFSSTVSKRSHGFERWREILYLVSTGEFFFLVRGYYHSHRSQEKFCPMIRIVNLTDVFGPERESINVTPTFDTDLKMEEEDACIYTSLVLPSGLPPALM